MKPFTYLSVCSGIEAATVAWHPLGCTPVAFSEIEKFPSAVLAHHWPDVPNLGDLTKYHEWTIGSKPDLIVGGTPCQAFSVAGLRQGLEDPRGNLTLVFLGLLERVRPKWVVWENVPGVLSDKTGAFGAFLGGLGQLGYGFAYRIFDAQYFGVAQRRRRVFVVAHLGDWRRAAAVLFEPESLRGDPPPSREAWQGTAGGVANGAGSGCGRKSGTAGAVIAPDVVGALDTQCGGDTMSHQTVAQGHVIGTITARMFNSLGARDVEEGALLPVCYGLDSEHNGRKQLMGPVLARAGTNNLRPTVAVAHTLRAEHDGSEDGTGRGTPIVPVSFYANESRCDNIRQDGTSVPVKVGSGGTSGNPPAVAYPIDTMNHLGRGDDHSLGDFDPNGPQYTLTKGHSHAVACINMGGDKGGVSNTSDGSAFTLGTNEPHAVAFEPGSVARNAGPSGESPLSPTLRREMGDILPAVRMGMQVRRLTPRECERLQGFPDDHTLIPYRGWPAADGPRYKAVGNSMAVPVMRWIGKRIMEVDAL